MTARPSQLHHERQLADRSVKNIIHRCTLSEGMSVKQVTDEEWNTLFETIENLKVLLGKLEDQLTNVTQLLLEEEKKDQQK